MMPVAYQINGLQCANNLAMSNIDTINLAKEFLTAFSTGAMIPEPPSARYSDFDMHAAYGVEAEFTRLRTAAGHKTTGLKVGYANKAMWRALKLETLVWAHMYDDTVHYAKDGAAAIALPYYDSCRIEPEIVFKLKQPVAAEPLEAVDWLTIGFEIIHCPFPDWRFQPADFVAAFGLHLRLVVGETVRIEAARNPALLEELARFKVRIFKNGEFVEEGSGKNSLRSPALCLAELGRATPLGVGDLVSSGTLTAGHAMAKGETWRVEVEGLPLAGLTLHTE
jgi:2-keto-4-pentenoate hydratase